MNFYRYKNVNTTAGVRVDELKYSLIKETLKGYWIARHWDAGLSFEYLKERGLLRWISKTARKKYSYETRERAWVNYQLRKLREIKILEERLKNARGAYYCEQPKESDSPQ